MSEHKDLSPRALGPLALVVGAGERLATMAMERPEAPIAIVAVTAMGIALVAAVLWPSVAVFTPILVALVGIGSVMYQQRETRTTQREIARLTDDLGRGKLNYERRLALWARLFRALSETESRVHDYDGRGNALPHDSGLRSARAVLRINGAKESIHTIESCTYELQLLVDDVETLASLERLLDGLRKATIQAYEAGIYERDSPEEGENVDDKAFTALKSVVVEGRRTLWDLARRDLAPLGQVSDKRPQRP
jgi:hypothetical protein